MAYLPIAMCLNSRLTHAMRHSPLNVVEIRITGAVERFMAPDEAEREAEVPLPVLNPGQHRWRL